MIRILNRGENQIVERVSDPPSLLCDGFIDIIHWFACAPRGKMAAQSAGMGAGIRPPGTRSAGATRARQHGRAGARPPDFLSRRPRTARARYWFFAGNPSISATRAALKSPAPETI